MGDSVVREVREIVQAAREYARMLRHIAPRRASPRTTTCIEMTDRELFAEVSGLEGARAQVEIRANGTRPKSMDRVLFEVGGGVRVLVRMDAEREARFSEAAQLGGLDSRIVDVREIGGGM